MRESLQNLKTAVDDFEKASRGYIKSLDDYNKKQEKNSEILRQIVATQQETLDTLRRINFYLKEKK